jgi:hypothetical protein
MSDPGRPLRPKKESELGFKRQPMVGWLGPKFLVRAGLEVALSGLFAGFADKREVEAGVPGDVTEVSDRDEDGALWIDYVADVGEGFESTYTVARLLAKPSLGLEWDGARYVTKRGRLLILGGDQVYPSASWEAYRDRFVGPYRAALPHSPEAEAPHLYAIPGNHDWYDGLTSFMRLFCQGAWIGGWQTRQRRSYFALQLPHRWWLWATDIQFDTYIDGPQLSYFRNARNLLRPADRVIIATAKPSWVDAEPNPGFELMKQGSWEALSYLEEELVATTGAKVALTLSGDKHHYARYHRDDQGSPQERITAGGGGAHTSTTHGLPARLMLTGSGSSASVPYTRKGVSPTPDQSLEMRKRLFGGVARVWTLGLLIGTIYAILALLLAAGVKDQATDLQTLADHSYWDVIRDATTFWSVLLVVALFFGLKAFASVKPGPRLSAKPKRWVFGALHTAGHVVPAVLLTALGLWLLGDWGWAAGHGMLLGWLVAAGLVAVGFSLGRLVFALYLWLANLNDGRQHATEINGAIASTEYKNFLRLRLAADGSLTIYPVGIRSCPRWRLARPDEAAGDSWFVPDDGESEPEPRLIESPISISVTESALPPG